MCVVYFSSISYYTTTNITVYHSTITNIRKIKITFTTNFNICIESSAIAYIATLV